MRVFFLFSCIFFLFSCKGGVQTLENEALEKIYQAIDLKKSWNKLSFKPQTEEDARERIRRDFFNSAVKDNDGHVVELHFGNFAFQKFPEVLGAFRKLTTLKFSGTDLAEYGLPKSIGMLSSLTALEISHITGKWTGSLPDEFAHLSELKSLKIQHWKKIKGPIPKWLASLTKLEDLLLINCSFSGNIPETLGSLTKLKTLSLASNSLEGSLPESLGQLNSLEVLELRDNGSLGGKIPDSILNLVDKKLKTLSMSLTQTKFSYTSEEQNLLKTRFRDKSAYISF